MNVSVHHLCWQHPEPHHSLLPRPQSPAHQTRPFLVNLSYFVALAMETKHISFDLQMQLRTHLASIKENGMQIKLNPIFHSPNSLKIITPPTPSKYVSTCTVHVVHVEKTSWAINIIITIKPRTQYSVLFLFHSNSWIGWLLKTKTGLVLI